ncbi:MFS transporter [Pseudobutyrivibrio xylanivorans]|uniref:Glycoside/pentoside/hexuronide:cation symporter, GPH family n=1 Tax=Pseudobutyrivibrio xylanivorans DSM 14809 TaxID=1123012 RepID=A0A1M6KGF0_PSEXY|nr:MFS transporter [Pseudobutyrivibrio xylanivorans]SHJ58011.1 glycoside/pentoside/hexuronide:cation symporter, GPH family [Pseudobutyrivibrio xylanivorans DSM 14809]
MKKQDNIWASGFLASSIKSNEVKLPEMAIGYFIGPFGALLSSGIFTSMLQKYLNEVLGLSNGFLTLLPLVSTVLIIIANLVVGQLIEHTKALAGKARPWILLSALTLSIASVLMFIVPAEGTARMIWIAIAYNLYYSVAYPIYNTANSTLVPVSTRDSKQRGAIASFTNVAGLGVMGAGSMVFPILASNVLGENQHRWFIVMVCVAIFTAMTILLQYKFTRERVTEENFIGGTGDGTVTDNNTKTATISEQLKAVTTEKWWWIIIIFYLLFQWSGAIKNGSMTQFCEWVLKLDMVGNDWGIAQTILSIAGAVPMAVAAVFVVPLANKFGKAKVTFAGLAIGAVGGILAGLFSDNIIMVGIGVALKCFGSSPACYLILAMLADVIDHIEFKSGIRTDGLTMSIYSSLMVAASPIGTAIMNALLTAGGFDQSIVFGAGVQSAAAQSALSVSYIWIETFAYIFCAVLAFFFTVEKNLSAEQAEIAKRKGL